MQLHLKEIASSSIKPAGWRERARDPSNISLPPLPQRGPELIARKTSGSSCGRMPIFDSAVAK
jgi:hypothetical protein